MGEAADRRPPGPPAARGRAAGTRIRGRYGGVRGSPIPADCALPGGAVGDILRPFARSVTLPPMPHPGHPEVEATLDAGGQAYPNGTVGGGEDHLRGALHALQVAVYTTDREGRVTLFNERAAELWGRRPEIRSEERRVGKEWRSRWVQRHSE